MGISTANSTGQDDRLNNLLTCLERAEKAHGGRRRAGIEKDGRLSALCRDFPLAGAPNNVGSRKGDDQRQPTTLQPGMPDDVDLERIRTAIHGLHDEHHVSHLPRATQLPPIPGLAPVGSHRAVTTRVSIDLDKLIPTPTWRRPGSYLLCRDCIPGCGHDRGSVGQLFCVYELASSNGFRGGTEPRVKRNATRPTLPVAASRPAIYSAPRPHGCKRGRARTPIGDAFGR